MYYLMIKTHKNTGLKYLCKTSCQNPEKYHGSGIYWKKHLKKHSKNISTEILFKTEDINMFNLKCLEYSRKYDVEKSKNWANLIVETGLDGGKTHEDPYWLYEYKHSDEIKKKISEASKNSIELRRARGDDLGTFRGKSHSNETKRKMSVASLGKPKSKEHRLNISKSKAGVAINLTPRQRKKYQKNMTKMLYKHYMCNICNRIGNAGHLKRYHKECQKEDNYNPKITNIRQDDFILDKCAVCGDKYSKKRKSKTKTCSRSCATKLQWRNTNEKARR